MAFDIPSFHRQAVETPSHKSIDEMRSLLVDTLEDAGEYPEIDDRGNVVVSRGDTDGRHILLNTHIDTVPPHLPYERRTEPPGPDETVDGSGGDGEGDIVCGRGACDAKGPLAALLDAFLTVTPDDGRVTLAISTDEETTQTGGAHLAETIDADGYIVGEPTGLDVCTAARGQFEGTVTIHGESAHAADPGSGHNAIRAAAPILQAMESYDDKKGPGEHETLGYPILTPSMVEGGEATNQVPAECTITFDRRSVPPETSESFCADLQAHLEQWLPDSMALTVGLIRPDTPFPEAFATDTDTELVRTLQEASGGGVRQFGAATEASYFASNGPTVVFGPGDLSDEIGAVAHSKREYVRLSEVRTAARAVRETVERLV
ncbi:acetylornithine deacetylase/succinyl-diaminopimelate desuccinylase [Haloarcula vallismortis]|uniref:Succinyl-diaminopimelate desuccinylase n=2 Tax=Haloarcula vallismortis TaxID=28442 RepID=M0JIZ1_HALVA|nr:M20 family metallopeptidase [Haloarcula vallismortis]EMA07660.1 succinyl-diaminopimelate desuccinylase [Haloarcula vallismortis ATCC 29715]SDW74757.1 acetylornithine deacetylase/succinyl-diaminopimelate desuccinylase [Haloarcula vallismortis]